MEEQNKDQDNSELLLELVDKALRYKDQKNTRKPLYALMKQSV